MTSSIRTEFDWTADPSTGEPNRSPEFVGAARGVADYFEQMSAKFPGHLTAVEAGVDVVARLATDNHLAPPRPIGITDFVWVQLTYSGICRLLEVFPPGGDRYCEYQHNTESGWTRFPVHEFMYAFGGIMYFPFDLGSSVFEGNQFQFFPPAE